MSPHASQWQHALEALLFIVGWCGGEIPVHVTLDGQEHGTWTRWAPGQVDRVRWLIRELDEQHDVEVSLGMPRPRVGFGTSHHTGCVWVVADSPERVERLSWFKPAPTVVLAYGAVKVAVWMLERRLKYQHALAANRRIAYRIGAVQKHGDPDLFRLPVPGTCRRVGRVRPAPVGVERLEASSWTARELVGDGRPGGKALRDPPPAFDFRKAVG